MATKSILQPKKTKRFKTIQKNQPMEIWTSLRHAPTRCALCYGKVVGNEIHHNLTHSTVLTPQFHRLLITR